MEMIKLHPLCASVLIINVLTGCIRASYNFKTEEIRSIQKSFRITYRGKYSEHPFADIKFEARKELCLKAQEEHSSSLSKMNEEHPVFEAEVRVIRYFDSEKELRDVVIECPTTPSSYLRLEDRNKPRRVNIMLVQNISERYKFVEEFVLSVKLVETTSAQINEGDDEETDGTGLEDVPEDDLSFWTTEDRMNLCNAARNHAVMETQGNMIMSQKQFATSTKPEIYEFEYSKKKIHKRVAVKCPTSPVMYIHLDEEPDLIKVVLLKGDFPKASSSSSSRQPKS